MIPVCSDKHKIMPGAPVFDVDASAGGAEAGFAGGRRDIKGRAAAGMIVTLAFPIERSTARTR
jgi:hypothetical protein